MMGTLTTAAASPLSARLTRFKNRRLVTRSSATPQLANPAGQTSDQQHHPDRRAEQTGDDAKGYQGNARADGAWPDTGPRQVLGHPTMLHRYTRLKMTTQTASTKCQ